MKADPVALRDSTANVEATPSEAAPAVDLQSTGRLLHGWMAVSVVTAIAVLVQTFFIYYPALVLLAVLGTCVSVVR